MIDHVPPQNLDMEKAVLGACLIQESAIVEASSLLRYTDFYRSAYGTMFGAMCELHASGEPVDILTLQEKLREAGKLEECGGLPVIACLPDSVVSASNILHYAGIVLDASVRRAVIDRCRDTIELAHHFEEPASITMTACIDDMRAMELRASGERPATDIRESVGEWFDAKEARQKSGRNLGMDTGLTALDKMTLGIVRGQYWVLKGPSSAGKTALGVQIADWVSARGHTVMIDSHEMSDWDIYDRLAAQTQSLDLRRLREASLDEEGRYGEWEGLGKFAAEMSERKTFIIRRPRDARISSTIAAARRVPNLDMLVVDYLQRIEPETANENEVIKTQNVSRALANFAQQGGPAVLALSQTNEDGKTAWARSIFNDADVLIGIVPDDNCKHDAVTDAKLVVEKQRNGPTGVLPVRFHRAYTRFAMRDDR